MNIVDDLDPTDHPEQIRVPEGIYLFCSFDLAGSTRYKHRVQGNWVQATNLFYQAVAKCLNSQKADAPEAAKGLAVDVETEPFVTMKFVGDEVVSYAKVRSKDDVIKLVNTVENALHGVYDELESVPNVKKAVDDHNLGVKATVWMAKIDASTAEAPRNIFVVTGDGRPDFLGMEMDAGFRVAGHAYRGVVTIAPDLAWMLLRFARMKSRTKPKSKTEVVTYSDVADNIAGRLTLVSWEEMKGCWADRKVPVVWLSVRDADWDFYDRLDLRVAALQKGGDREPEVLFKNLTEFFNHHERTTGLQKVAENLGAPP